MVRCYRVSALRFDAGDVSAASVGFITQGPLQSVL
jgi:hypothetical protein